MPELTIIADDLTGAADCGIAFALAGLPTFVAFGKGPPPGDAQVLALDTDSRAASPEEASRRVHAAAKDVWGRGARTLYKKIDSTLRGHVAEAGARPDAAVVWVGSGGLARHLPAALRLRPATTAARRFAPREGPVLALVGSRSSVAREQARELCAQPGTACIELAADALFSEREVPEARNALEAGRDVVLIIGAGDEVDLSRSLRLATALARLAAPLVGRVAGAIATGCDIARALLAALGASGVWLAR